MTVPLTTRPLTDFSWWCRPEGSRRGSGFSVTYSTALGDLCAELDAMGARDAVLQVACREDQISRATGMVLASAAIEHPAAKLLVDTPDRGLLVFACDRYTVNWSPRHLPRPWMHNMRAIGLTLTALRAVERYGATDSGQQYRAYLAIEGRSMRVDEAGMSEAQAKVHLLRLAFAAGDDTALWAAADWERFDPKLIVRRATLHAHPDANAGDDARWNLLHNAQAVLRATGALTA